jgi:phenylacetate-coenzyme A ligase PaaK-like adenylate-forming protein
VPRPSFDARAEAGLLKEIRSRLGDQIRIEIVRLHEIPREANGKFRAMKSAVGRA